MIRLCLFLLTFVPLYSFATTPSDVHHQVNKVITQIEAIKAKLANSKSVRTPGIQIGKTPLHVYAKGLELLEKIQRLQTQQSLPALDLPQLPSQAVTPGDVMVIMKLAESEIAKLNSKNGVSADLTKVTRNAVAKTPSDVYQKVWQASYLMDSLIPAIKPADVLRNVQMIEKSLISIAQKQGKKLTLAAPDTYTTKKPTDVSIQLYSLLYKLARLERQLDIKPLLVVPSFPAGKIKPEDVFDVTGNVLADLTRIAQKLDINSTQRLEVPSGKISPNDVYAQAERLNNAAHQLLD